MILLTKDFWEIKKTKNKGRGMFATKNISGGAIIGDYLGKVIHPKNATIDESNFYLMYYHNRAVIVPDLEKPGVHLINHSCVPNCFLYIYKGHTLAFALKNILKGEELSLVYLLAPINKFCDPCSHVCKCGSPKCLGNMHLSQEKFELWRKLTEKQAKETKKERIRYGKDLIILTSYPNRIPSNYIKQVNKIFA